VAELVLLGLDALEGLAGGGPQGRVEQADLVVEVEGLAGAVLVREELVERNFVLEDDLVEVVQLQQLGDELLQVRESVFEKSEVGKVGRDAFAHADASNLGLLVKFGVIHR